MRKLDIYRFCSFAALFALVVLLNSCTKEVTIDIPGYQEQLVIDGRIETDQPPFVLLSKSKEVYASTDLEAFLNGFVSGAIVTVSNGTTSIQLTEVCSDNLPPGTEALAAQMFGVPVEELQNYTLCAYTSLDPNIWGEIGKSYTLTVTYEGQTYSAETSILSPTSFVNSYWKPDGATPNLGYSWVTLADPAGTFDGYRWDVKRIKSDSLGNQIDQSYRPTFNPIFDDEFFDGLTFDFWYENPYATGEGYTETTQWLYELGDTVVIKLSKMDESVYDYMEKKYTQLQTAGNPFATPTNIPNNIEGGALGIWAGYSPSFDTLICVP
ncbi:MAG: hypothetical protein ACI865_000123 [Flavobacteriaceae bacterium]|jgi:hypothetical protein